MLPIHTSSRSRHSDVTWEAKRHAPIDEEQEQWRSHLCPDHGVGVVRQRLQRQHWSADHIQRCHSAQATQESRSVRPIPQGRDGETECERARERQQSPRRLVRIDAAPDDVGQQVREHRKSPALSGR